MLAKNGAGFSLQTSASPNVVRHETVRVLLSLPALRLIRAVQNPSEPSDTRPTSYEPPTWFIGITSRFRVPSGPHSVSVRCRSSVRTKETQNLLLRACIWSRTGRRTTEVDSVSGWTLQRHPLSVQRCVLEPLDPVLTARLELSSVNSLLTVLHLGTVNKLQLRDRQRITKQNDT